MKPTEIAIWNGVVMGGGVGLSNHAKFRIATDTTVYAMPETGIGFFTDVAGSYFLPRMKNNPCLGMFLGLTGHRLKGKDLLTWGVATHYVPNTELDSLKQELVKYINKNSKDYNIEDIINRHAVKDSGVIENLEEINTIFKDEGTIQDLMHRLERFDSNFSKKTLKRMQRMSPLSLAVVFEQLKRGKSMELKEVFQMEYKIF